MLVMRPSVAVRWSLELGADSPGHTAAAPSCAPAASVPSAVLPPPPYTEALSVEAPVTEMASERFDMGILPRTAGLDEQRRHPRSTAPVAHPVSHQLRPVVRAKIDRHTSLHNGLPSPLQNVDRLPLPLRENRQAVPRAVIHPWQDLQGTTFVGPI